MAYDVLVKGGRVIDPAQGINGVRDIGVDEGRIVAIAPDLPAREANSVIDAEGMIVTPGLIDLHTHVAEAIVPLAAPPDQVGVMAGVTTVCDAGSTGYANFNGFRKLVIPGAQTDVFCYLHLFPVGEVVLPEIGYHDINPEHTLNVITENRDTIKGIKVRAIGDVMLNHPDVMQTAKSIASEAGLPIVVHLGIGLDEAVPDELATTFTRDLLSQLDSGDILTHCFTAKVGGVIGLNDQVLPELREAVARGVILDVAASRGHLSFQVARRGIDEGFVPTTLSTDVTISTYEDPAFYSLPTIMSKFLALGFSLDQVVAMTTSNPARVLGEEDMRGSLRMGMPADLSILEPVEGDFVFSDGAAGNAIQGSLLLRPKLTLKRGVEIPTRSAFKDYKPEAL